MTAAAVIFDCDGTLVNSEPLAWRSWERLLAEHGYTLTREDIELTRGRGYPEIHGHFRSECRACRMAPRCGPGSPAGSSSCWSPS